MRIEIFDVVHGHCTVVTAPNGRCMMLDCGQRWGDQTFWTPSLHYFNQTIDVLALLNLDEDHVSDFEGVTRNCRVPWILSNPTIGPNEFTVLKKDGTRLEPGPKGTHQTLLPPIQSWVVPFLRYEHQIPHANAAPLPIVQSCSFDG